MSKTYGVDGPSERPEETKRCTKCGILKGHSKFNYRADTKDNLQYWCKKCTAEYKALAQPTRKEYNHKYYRTVKYRKKSVSRQARRRQSGCLKTKARDLLQGAVREGRITKPSICSGCNAAFPVKQIEGHHIDYNLPYFVQWLCRKCHDLVC